MELFDESIRLIGACFASFIIPTLWIAYFYRSPIIGFFIGLGTAILISVFIQDFYLEGIVRNSLAMTIDGLFLGWLGKKLRKPKKN